MNVSATGLHIFYISILLLQKQQKTGETVYFHCCCGTMLVDEADVGGDEIMNVETSLIYFCCSYHPDPFYPDLTASE